MYEIIIHGFISMDTYITTTLSIENIEIPIEDRIIYVMDEVAFQENFIKKE